MVSYKRGQLTAEVVERLAKRHKMITYPGMGHEGTLVSRDQYDADYYNPFSFHRRSWRISSSLSWRK